MQSVEETTALLVAWSEGDREAGERLGPRMAIAEAAIVHGRCLFALWRRANARLLGRAASDRLAAGG